MRIIWGAVLGAAALLAVEARADCALPADYSVTEAPAGTVTIRLWGAGRKCPDDGLLRQGPGAADVVKITTCDGDDFVDQCVPAGTYRYGLATPYQCQPSSCGTFFFTTAVVAGAAPECVRTVAAPVAATGVPWGDDRTICGYGAGRETGCGLAPAGTVLGTNLALFLLGMALWRWRAGRRARG